MSATKRCTNTPGRCTSSGPIAPTSTIRSASTIVRRTATAFAFAYAIGRHLPELAVPIRLLAATVAYSRVHTGVHYPGDVVIGTVAGAGTAAMVAAAFDRLPKGRSGARAGLAGPGRLSG